MAVGSRGRPLSSRLPRPWLFPAAVYAALWPLLLLAWHIGDDAAGEPVGWLRHSQLFDSGLYISIAENGYPAATPFRPDGSLADGRPAFFPLFPLLLRWTGTLTRLGLTAAGVLLTVLTGLAAAYAVWFLARRICPPATADKALLLFSAFPGTAAYTLYTEPLSVALGAATLLALIDCRWLLAGLLGAAGTATRPVLLVLVPIAALEALRASRRGDHKAWIAPLLTPAGAAAFLLTLGHRYRDYAFWLHAESRGWGQHTDYGVQTVERAVWAVRLMFGPVYQATLTASFVFAVVAMAVLCATRFPLCVKLFGVLVPLLSFTATEQNSKPRFIWAAFPLFIALAAKLPRGIFWPLLTLSTAALLYLNAVWLHLPNQPAP